MRLRQRASVDAQERLELAALGVVAPEDVGDIVGLVVAARLDPPADRRVRHVHALAGEGVGIADVGGRALSTDVVGLELPYEIIELGLVARDETDGQPLATEAPYARRGSTSAEGLAASWKTS